MSVENISSPKTSFEFPIAAAQLVPQKAPMRLLTQLLKAEEKEICGIARVEKDSPFYLDSGFILSSAFIEMAAQCLAAAQYLENQSEQKQPSLGYLVGVKNFVVYEAGFLALADKDFEIKSVGETIMAGFAISKAQIFQDNKLLAALELKAWIPN